MEKEIQRFRVFKQDYHYPGEVVFKASTTQECYDFLITQDMGLNQYRIDCVVDDIEVDADEFMQAFKEGECPGDLQFF